MAKATTVKEAIKAFETLKMVKATEAEKVGSHREKRSLVLRWGFACQRCVLLRPVEAIEPKRTLSATIGWIHAPSSDGPKRSS